MDFPDYSDREALAREASINDLMRSIAAPPPPDAYSASKPPPPFRRQPAALKCEFILVILMRFADVTGLVNLRIARTPWLENFTAGIDAPPK